MVSGILNYCANCCSPSPMSVCLRTGTSTSNPFSLDFWTSSMQGRSVQSPCRHSGCWSTWLATTRWQPLFSAPSALRVLPPCCCLQNLRKESSVQSLCLPTSPWQPSAHTSQTNHQEMAPCKGDSFWRRRARCLQPGRG